MTDFENPTTTYRGVLREWKDWYIGLIQGWQIWLIVGLMQALALAGDVATPSVDSHRLIHLALLAYCAYKVNQNWGRYDEQ